MSRKSTKPVEETPETTPAAEPIAPEVARAALETPGGVTLTSRYTRLRLTIDPGDAKRGPTVVQFENGVARVTDPSVIEKVLSHPCKGVDFQQVA